MQAQTTNLFLFNDLDDSSRTANLASGDLNALRTVTDWIKTFVGRPNKDLSRSGPICPFVQGSWERMTLWLAPEHIADSSAPDVVQLANDYKRLLLDMRPVDATTPSTKPSSSSSPTRRRIAQRAISVTPGCRTS
jgi:hypothetical protein